MKCTSCGFENPPGMKFCGGCGQPLATHQPETRPSTSAAERRQMTVLFCDLVGSTPLAEALDPEDLHEVIGDYRRACARALERFGGHLGKYIGDGMIVFFGYPTAFEDDASRAAHTGLAILDEVAKLNTDLERRFGVRLRVRIGAHTGLVVAGSIGGEGGETDIVGETPNIAARLESVAEHDTMFVSGATAAFIDRYFELTPRGEVALTGVSRGIEAFRVERATGVVGRIDVTGEANLAPMRGRDAELDQLLGVWQDAVDGHGQLALVSAPAGMGKSRMVKAVVDRVEAQAGAVTVWQCSPHHQTRTLHPVIGFLEEWLGIDRANPDASLQAVKQALADADLSTDEAVHALATLLGLDAALGDEASFDAREARATTLRVLGSLLVFDARRHPLLLIVDDVQWADPTTLVLLERLINASADLPIMVLFAGRPEFEVPWRSQVPVTNVQLQPLSPTHVAAMLTAMSDRATIADSMLDRVVQASDGVPLFVEEMVKMLASEDAVSESHDVPASLRGLLMARLDQLGEDRHVVNAAAVLGREFSADVLQSVFDGSHDVGRALARLTAAGVLAPSSDLSADYVFSHSLLREITYGSLLRRRRQELHGDIAAALSMQFAEQVAAEPEAVAYHWSRAGQPNKAVPHWLAAGNQALASASFREAADHFRRGIEDQRSGARLGDSQPESETARDEADLLTSLGAAMQAGWGYATDEVDDLYRLARKPSSNSGGHRIDAIDRGEFMMYLLRAKYDVALEVADNVLQRGEATGDQAVLLEGHLYVGLANMYLGDLGLTCTHLDAAATSASPGHQDRTHDALGDSRVMAMSYLAPVLWSLGYPDISMETSDRSLERADVVARPMTYAQTWGMRAIFSLNKGDRRVLADWVDRSYQYAGDHNIPYWRSLTGCLHGWLQGRLGNVAAGLETIAEHRESYLASGSRLGLPLFCTLTANLRELDGDLDGALRELAEAEQHIADTNEGYFSSGVSRSRARLLLAKPEPDVDAALAALQAASAIDYEQNAKTRELESLLLQIPLYDDDDGGAQVLVPRLTELCDWFTTHGGVPGFRSATAFLAERSDQDRS